MAVSFKRDKKLNQLLMCLAGNYFDSDNSFLLLRYNSLTQQHRLCSRISGLLKALVPLSLSSLWHSV